jgi:hypothetical protein
MHPHLPPSAWGLGLLGLLPFIGTALAALSLPEPAASSWLAPLAAYGAVTLGFLGGVHWGLVLAPAEIAPSRPGLRLLLGVLPLLIGRRFRRHHTGRIAPGPDWPGASTVSAAALGAQRGGGAGAADDAGAAPARGEAYILTRYLLFEMIHVSLRCPAQVPPCPSLPFRSNAQPTS